MWTNLNLVTICNEEPSAQVNGNIHVNLKYLETFKPMYGIKIESLNRLESSLRKIVKRYPTELKMVSGNTIHVAESADYIDSLLDIK